MSYLDQYLIPYAISQVVSLIILLAAYRNIRTARLLFSLMFMYAGMYNMYIWLRTPEAYLEFAPMAIPLYREFILGWFSAHNYILVPIISVGQLAISVLMLLHGWRVKLACTGGIFFLIAIAPLGIGAAFPFSITVSIALFLIIRSRRLEQLWTKVHTVSTTFK